MNINSEWLPLVAMLLAGAVGYGILQNQVDHNTSESKYLREQRDLMNAQVMQNTAGIQAILPLSEKLQETLASLDKTLATQLATQGTEIIAIKEDIKEIKQATVR